MAALPHGRPAPKGKHDCKLVDQSQQLPSQQKTLLFAKKSTSDFVQQHAGARKVLVDILESAYAEIGMTVLVIINLVLAIILVDTEASGREAPVWVTVSLRLLVAVYCVEVTARVYVHRLQFFSATVNVFDFVIVLADVFGAISEVVGGGAIVDVAAFRILRTFRLLRSARILSLFRSLYLLTNGVQGAMRAVIWAFLMISLVLVLCSVFAVAAIQPLVTELANTSDVFDGCSRCAMAYSSVWHAYMTLFQQIVAGDSWGTVTMQVMDAHPWTSLFFLPSFLVIQLGLINMILAVIVDSAEDAREANNALKLELKERDLLEAQKSLEEMCAAMDKDNSGALTLDELIDGFDTNQRFYETLTLMDIDKEDMKIVFGILDEDKSGACTYSEFVEALWKMKSQDSHTLLVLIKSYVHECARSLQESMSVLKDDIGIKLNQLHALHAGYSEEVGSLTTTAFRPSGVSSEAPRPSFQEPNRAADEPNRVADIKTDADATMRSVIAAERHVRNDALKDATANVGFAALLTIKFRKIEQKLDKLFQQLAAPCDTGATLTQPSCTTSHQNCSQVQAVLQPRQPRQQQQQSQPNACLISADAAKMKGLGEPSAGFIWTGKAKLPKAPTKPPEVAPPSDNFTEGEFLQCKDACVGEAHLKRPHTCCD